MLSSLKLLETLSENQVSNCYMEKPTLYKRGEFKVDERIKKL